MYTTKKELLEEIMMYDFAVQEVTLFLDLRPCDEKALEYFHYYVTLLKEKKKEYEKEFGALSNRSTYARNYKCYAGTAFPWTREGC